MPSDGTRLGRGCFVALSLTEALSYHRPLQPLSHVLCHLHHHHRVSDGSDRTIPSLGRTPTYRIRFLDPPVEASSFVGLTARLAACQSQVVQLVFGRFGWHEAFFTPHRRSARARRRPPRPFFFDGSIDEVFIFGRRLTASEIVDLAQSPPPPPSCRTNLDAAAYWCFDDSENPTTDGGKGADASIVGARSRWWISRQFPPTLHLCVSTESTTTLGPPTRMG